MTQHYIKATGVRVHNLRDITVAIPKRKLTVVTGVSGSGKSSLVFDTIAAESQRQLGETFSTFVRNRLPQHGRPELDTIENLSAAIVVDQKKISGNNRSTVGTITDIYALLRLLFSRLGTPHIGDSNAFSFNDPAGMCPRCKGIGVARSVDVDNLINKKKSLNEGAIEFPTLRPGGWMWRTIANSGLFDLDKPLGEYNAAEWEALCRGDGKTFEGMLTRFERIWLPKDAESLKGRTREAFDRVVRQGTCPDCHGERLCGAALSSRIAGRTIAECSALEAEELVEFVRALDAAEVAPVRAELLAQLHRLSSIGLGYLRIDRPTATLSGGESQRVKMVRHLGSSLTDMTYIFDEPSIGLHPHDVAALTELLKNLRDKGNTVIVVEHDPDVIAVADHIIDIGPGAGDAGGRIVYQGTVAGLRGAATITGRQLRGAKPADRTPRAPRGAIPIRGASTHNLRDIDVDIPLGVLTAVTGVAGSGKSSLIHGSLPGDVTVLDQRAVHVSRRSSPATYTGMLDPIRALFAQANGVRPALFSANAEGGCAHCGGLGVTYTDLAFVDPVVSSCERCGGRRFTQEALRHRYRGNTIADVYELSVREALNVFDDKRVRPILERLFETGLGYLTIGQPLTTLSGGERQRLKLAVELQRGGGSEPGTGTDKIYVFDEPTTGLHSADVAGLLALVDRLVDARASVIVIEHNLEVIAAADWVIDLGPGAGKHGGRVLHEGTPRQLAAANNSPTAEHLARHFG